MQMNFFKWFDLPEQYTIDLNALKKKYYALSKTTHPDNFQGQSQFERKMAEQALGYTHEAYAVLSCPVQRAIYILALNYIDISNESEQQQYLSPDFLEMAFDWQAKIQEVKQNTKNTKNKEAVMLDLENNMNSRLSQMVIFLHSQQFDLAAPLVKEIQFIQKIREQS